MISLEPFPQHGHHHAGSYHVDSQGMDQPCHVSKGLKPEEFRKYRLYRRSVCANVSKSLQAVHTSGADDLQLASRERRRHAVTCKRDSTTDSASYTACWAGSTTWNASLCLCARKAGKSSAERQLLDRPGDWKDVKKARLARQRSTMPSVRVVP